MMIRVATDRHMPGAVIGLIFSGPIEIRASRPRLKGGGSYQFSVGEPLLDRRGNIIPNSIFVRMLMPAAFSPGQK
jgi:hypothetical protein